MDDRSSIGFGGGEVIEVGLPLEEVRALVEAGIKHRLYVEFMDTDGERLVINPKQVKVIQRAAPLQPLASA